MARSRKIEVELVGDSSSLERAFRRSEQSAKKLSIGIGTIAKSALGFAAVGGAITSVTTALRASIDEFSDQQKVAAQTAAAIQSTGGAANVTAKHIDSLAASISQLSGIDDEVVQTGENMLLTFTQIQNRVGKTNDIFDQATRAAADLSVAMGLDMKQAALQVGKALNDPARGYARLQRIGVAFSKSQVDQIKGFVKLGQTANAQKVILAELTKEFGGSAKALGQTVPGQLNRLKETLRNVGGGLVGAVAPAFNSLLGFTNDFVDRIGKARTVKAKVNVVVDRAQQVGRNLYGSIKAAVDAVNWGNLLDTAKQEIRSAMSRAVEAVESVNWGAVGHRVGNAISAALGRLSAAVRAVDWNQLGQELTNGVGRALRALAKFLASVDWVSLAKKTIGLMISAFRGAVGLLAGIGEALGRGLISSIGKGLDAAGRFIEKKALQIALKIVEPLNIKVLGKHLVPGMDALVKAIKGKLAEIEEAAGATSRAIEGSFDRAGGAAERAAAKAASQAGAKPDKSADKAADAAKAQGASVSKAAAAAAEAAANAKKAAESAADKAEAAKQKRSDAFARILGALQLKVDRAGLTKRLDDDLAALKDLKAGLLKQIKAGVDVAAAQSQLVQVTGQIADKQAEIRQRAADAAQASQFRALGLTGTGDQVTPTVTNLKKQLASLTSRIAGTSLDTSATRGLLARIRKVLTDPLSKATVETRAKIKELFEGIRSGFSDEISRGPLTKGRKLDINKITEGLGLSGDALKTLQGRLSTISTAGIVPGGLVAFGQPVGQPVTIPITVELDGHTVATVVTKHQQKTGGRTSASTRGRFGGV